MQAIKNGADVIIDTDDDNIPKSGYEFPNFSGEFQMSEKDKGFVNIYKSFTDMHIWPRGFPLDLITNREAIVKKTNPADVNIGIWQGLADEDPDVDAIYRLIDNTPCYFQDNEPVVLAKGTLCPFNSQNTAYRKELFPLLYLPAFVTFRYTDILRGLVAQPIMWLYDFHLGFTKATVVQERNPHNYLKDFESEIPCYLYPDKVIDIVSKAIRKEYSVEDNLFQAYEGLCRESIVTNEEVTLLSSWLRDIS